VLLLLLFPNFVGKQFDGNILLLLLLLLLPSGSRIPKDLEKN